LAGQEVVIDSSAAVALAMRERGADAVPQYLARGLMSAVNVAEFVQVLRRYDRDPESYLRVFEQAGLRILPADAQLARLAGELERKTRSIGLSLGDRFCLALAIGAKRAVLTADRAWLAFDFGIDVMLARELHE
jgi:ribonuclease VapC